MHAKYLIVTLASCMVAITCGCGYSQPELTEAYGIIHPRAGIRVLEIDEQRVIDLSSRYILRVPPGNRRLVLAHGNDEATLAKGSKSYMAELPIEVEEGYRYYLNVKLHSDYSQVLPGFRFKSITAWEPVVHSKVKIANYRQKK